MPYTPSGSEVECKALARLETPSESTMNSRATLQLLLACTLERMASLAHIIRNELKLLTTSAVIDSCHP
jgi:hypothetical protein